MSVRVTGLVSVKKLVTLGSQTLLLQTRHGLFPGYLIYCFPLVFIKEFTFKVGRHLFRRNKWLKARPFILNTWMGFSLF
jgi:hypothetical protein